MRFWLRPFRVSCALLKKTVYNVVLENGGNLLMKGRIPAATLGYDPLPVTDCTPRYNQQRIEFLLRIPQALGGLLRWKPHGLTLLSNGVLLMDTALLHSPQDLYM